MGTYVRPLILKLFTERPGVILYADDIARELELSKRTVATAVYNMRRAKPLLEERIEIIVHGNAWRYTDPDVVSTDATPVNGASVAALVQPTAVAPVAATSAPATDRSNRPSLVGDTTAGDPTSGPATGSTGEPAPRLFEELGTKPNGDVLVADEDGRTYWLVPTKPPSEDEAD